MMSNIIVEISELPEEDHFAFLEQLRDEFPVSTLNTLSGDLSEDFIQYIPEDMRSQFVTELVRNTLYGSTDITLENGDVQSHTNPSLIRAQIISDQSHYDDWGGQDGNNIFNFEYLEYVDPQDRADLVKEVAQKFPELTMQNAGFLGGRSNPGEATTHFFSHEQELSLVEDLFEITPDNSFKFFNDYGDKLFGRLPSEAAADFLTKRMREHPDSALKLINGDAENSPYFAAIPSEQREAFVEDLMKNASPEAIREYVDIENMSIDDVKKLLDCINEEDLKNMSPEMQALYENRNNENFEEVYEDIKDGGHFENTIHEFAILKVEEAAHVCRLREIQLESKSPSNIADGVKGSLTNEFQDKVAANGPAYNQPDPASNTEFKVAPPMTLA